MSGSQDSSGVAFRSFLSHRYQSPRINECFFQILSADANPQFAVDPGTIATSVTRLERLIRDADAFIGIYPFPEDTDVTVERLKSESRYFRLELDLAERASKPAMVFVDSRYGNVIAPPPQIIQVRFKSDEIAPNVQSPRARNFRGRVDDFCRWVTASLAHQSSRAAVEEKTKVGVLLPNDASSGIGYSQRHIDLIEAEITKSAPRDVEIFKWPPVLDSSFAAKMETLDWIVADIGAASAASGIVGYLHGRFIPMVRLMQIPPGTVSDGGSPSPGDKRFSSSLVETLFGAYEVGYPKDIVRWSDEGTLQAEIEKRINVLYTPQSRVGTLDEAQAYFRRAARRNEAIFVSYSGKDADLAAEVITALKQRFQDVFDYRDAGKSIPGGASWIEEIFKRIAATPVGVPLYSPSYFESGNCEHEAREMLSRRDARKMKVVPVKLRQGDLTIPVEFGEMQYLRMWEYRDPGSLVDIIIQSIDV
jgi:hypothetical protein